LLELGLYAELLAVIDIVIREIVDTMVQAYSQKIFSGQLPVFDGRRNLYSREPLPIGREKVGSADISFLFFLSGCGGSSGDSSPQTVLRLVQASSDTRPSVQNVLCHSNAVCYGNYCCGCVAVCVFVTLIHCA